MEEDLRDAYRTCRPELALLAEERLSSIDLSQKKKVEAIGKVFSQFVRFESIGCTGASKVIHLLNPSLFMIWDTNVRVAYATLWADLWEKVIQKWPNDDSKNKLETLPPFKRKQIVQETIDLKTELYLQFMKVSQIMAQTLVNTKSESEFWLTHMSFGNDADFLTSWSFSETLTKMIDECNFIRWRIGEQF